MFWTNEASNIALLSLEAFALKFFEAEPFGRRREDNSYVTLCRLRTRLRYCALPTLNPKP